MYAEGLFVVRRPAVVEPGTRRKRGRTYVWVLHRATCGYIGRTKNAMPAPAESYKGTIGCRLCKPDVPPEGDDNEWP